MSHLDPVIDLGSNTDVDQVFNHLLRLVRNRSLTQYLASHPTAYNELVAAVHDIPPPKPLLTPASTPHDRDLPDEHAPSPPPSLPITREEEPICDNGCWDDTCVNDTDGPRAAQMNDRSLLNHDPPAALNNDGYTAETVDTTEHASSKRKQAFQDGSPSKRRHFECTGRAWSGADTRVSAVVLIQRTWRSREQVKAWRQYRHKVVLIQSLWRGKQACFVYNKYKQKIIYIQSFWRGKRDLRAYKEYRRKIVNIQSWWRGKHARQGDKETREVATSTASDSLSTEWRLAIQHISSIRVLEDCQEFCRQIRNPISRIDIRVDQDALKGDAGSQRDSASEQRLAQLKILITNTEEKEKSIKSLARVFQVWRRMHVVELANRYIEEVKAEDVAPKQGWRPSVMDRFTDVLFPDTIKHNGKSKGRRLSERKGKKRKGKQVSKEERKQVSEQEKKRKKAVRKVEYWKRLGMGLLGPVQCYGHGILILLSKDLTETRLNRLLQHQRKEVVDYIDLCHPGLKEQICNLSALLSGLEDHGFPADKRRLVIETVPRHELSGRSLVELFQFANDHDSSELLDSPREETPMASVAAVTALPVDATSDCSFDHSSTAEASSYDPDAIGSAEDPPQDCALDFTSGSDSGTPRCPSLEPCSDDYPLPPLPACTLWAGDCEINLSGAAIETRDRIVHNRVV